MDVSLYNGSFEFCCAHLKKDKASILKIRFGSRNVTKHLLNKRPDLKILATDLAPSTLTLTVNRQLISLRKAKGARGLESAVLRPVRIVHTILKPGKASIFKYHSGFWLVVEIQLFVCG